MHAESQVWEKLYKLVINPDFLLVQAKELAQQLQQNYEFLQHIQKELLKELEKQSQKRQQVITDARKTLRDDDEFAEEMCERYRGGAIEEQIGIYWARFENLYRDGLGNKSQ